MAQKVIKKENTIDSDDKPYTGTISKQKKQQSNKIFIAQKYFCHLLAEKKEKFYT